MVTVHPNIRQLLNRMEALLLIEDHSGVLHASASIFEVLAKEVVSLLGVQDQTLKSFFDRYRKDSQLPVEILDYIITIYNWRNRESNAGHSSLTPPTVSRSTAIQLIELTKAFVHIEYRLKYPGTQPAEAEEDNPDQYTGPLVIELSQKPPAEMSLRVSLAHRLDSQAHGPILHVAFSPDGRTLASAGSDSRTNLWDTTSGALVQSFEEVMGVNNIAYSPDGQYIAEARPYKIYFLHIPTGKRFEGAWLRNVSELLSINFDCTGRYLAIGGTHYPYLWKLDEKVGPEIFSREIKEIWEARFHPSKQILGLITDRLYLYDIDAGQELAQLYASDDALHSFSFHPFEEKIAIGSRSGTIRIWDMEQQEERLHWMGHEESIRAICYSADGSKIATGGNTCVRVWSALTGKMLAEFGEYQYGVHSLAYHPNGRMIAVAYTEATVDIWNIAGYQVT